MTWDYYDNYVVLFGGSTQGGTYNVYSADTWIFQSGVWTQLFPTISPEGRDSSGLAYSWWDDAVLLFGGYAPATGGYLNDTWLFKSGSWTQLDINGPSPRNGFGLAYDPVLEADVLFGGHSPQCPEQVCNDTWEFARDAWTQVATPAAPPQRWQMGMAFDAEDSDIILFGGIGVGTACNLDGACGDTWQFNATAGWVQVPTNVLCGTTAQGPCPAGMAPSPRHEPSMAYDYADGYVLLFGGWNSSSVVLGDTWEYSAGVWTQLSPLVSPTGRDGAEIAFDFSPGDGFLLLLGGSDTYVTPPDAIFGWRAGDWFALAPPATVSPGTSEGGSMVYDASDGYIVFFGGYNSTYDYVTGTWIYLHGVWTRLAIPGPTADWGQMMAYDPAEGYVLLFGGASGTNSTWAYHAGTWTELCGDRCEYGFDSPEPRYGSGIAYEPQSQTLVMFGGTAWEGPSAGWQLVSETWAWVATSTTEGFWENLTSYLGSSVPAPRAYPGMVFDAYDNEIVLYGGGNYSATFGDTWTMGYLFDGWHQLGSCGGPGQPGCSDSPPDVAAMVFVYDSETQAIVLSGGVEGSAFYGYLSPFTYLFQGGTWTQCTGWTCYAYYFGWGTYNGWGAAAYDPLDGYTLTEGGEGYYYNYGLGIPTYYFIPYSWVFGDPLFSQGPGFTPEHADVGQSVTFDVGATGGGNGEYSFYWAGLPTGCAPASPTETSFSCVMENNGFTQYGGTDESPDSYFDPSVQVADSSGSPSTASPDSASWLNWLYVAPDPRVSVDASTTVADVGQTVYFGLNTTYGWAPYNDSWVDLPPGCVVTSTGVSSEQATCALTEADVGVWSLSAETTDSVGFAAVSNTLELTVFPKPTATTIQSNTATLDAGQTLSLWVTGAGGDGSYTYAWTGVPAACLADAPTLSCTVPATETGRYTPSVTITDTLGVSVVGVYPGILAVEPAPTATALTVTNASGDPAATSDAGLAVTFALTSTPGSGSDAIAWQGLPGGCVAATSNSSTVHCSPTVLGTFSVSATITDANGASATSPVASLEIFPALSGGSVDASAHALDVGQGLELVASVTGGAPPLSYAWSGLPAGCLGSGTATVSCSPTAGGSFSPGVRATDANGAALLGSLSAPIVVSPDPTATALRIVDSAQNPVGTATVGTTVEFELTSTPGSGADTVTWSGLPSGCAPATSNSTMVTCTPDAAGTYAASASEVDRNGATATSPTATLIVTAPASAAPFASPVEWAQIGLLAALLMLGVVAVVLALRRPPRPTPSEGQPGPAPPPAAAAAGAGPSWKES